MKNLYHSFILIGLFFGAIGSSFTIHAFYVEDDYMGEGACQVMPDPVVQSKLDEVFNFFFARLSLIDNPKGADFVRIYNEMPKNFQQELCRIYFDMTISEQDEIAASYGYSGPELRVVAQKEIQNKVKKVAHKHVNKAVRDLRKIFKF